MYFFEFLALQLKDWRFHYISFPEIWSGFYLHINQVISLSLSTKPKHWNFTFQYFVAGVPSRDLKTLFCLGFCLVISIPLELVTLTPNIMFLLKFDPKIRKITRHLCWGFLIEVRLAQIFQKGINDRYFWSTHCLLAVWVTLKINAS